MNLHHHDKLLPKKGFAYAVPVEIVLSLALVVVSLVELHENGLCTLPVEIVLSLALVVVSLVELHENGLCTLPVEIVLSLALVVVSLVELHENGLCTLPVEIILCLALVVVSLVELHEDGRQMHDVLVRTRVHRLDAVIVGLVEQEPYRYGVTHLKQAKTPEGKS